MKQPATQISRSYSKSQARCDWCPRIVAGYRVTISVQTEDEQLVPVFTVHPACWKRIQELKL